MTPEQERAATVAHGAVVGLMNDQEGFSPGRFVDQEVRKLPASERGRFLLYLAIAAVTNNAATALTLHRIGLADETGKVTMMGLDMAEMLERAAELRREHERTPHDE